MLHILAPGLSQLLSGGENQALARLLAKADLKPAPQGYARTLAHLFGLADEAPIPVAAAYWLADTGLPIPSNLILAEPAHFRADIDKILLFAPSPPPAKLINQLRARFAKHFADDGLRLLEPMDASLQRWYLTASDHPGFSACALSDIPRIVPPSCMPQGEGAAFWRRAITEAQMLFHQIVGDSPGMPINGLWFSDGTEPRAMQPSGFEQVSGADDLLVGFARLAGIPHVSEVRAQRHLHVLSPGNSLVELAQRAVQLALAAGSSAQIYDCAGHSWVLRRWMRLRFWR